MLQDRKIHCLQARPYTFQPGNFTGCGNEGVNATRFLGKSNGGKDFRLKHTKWIRASTLAHKVEITFARLFRAGKLSVARAATVTIFVTTKFIATNTCVSRQNVFS